MNKETFLDLVTSKTLLKMRRRKTSALMLLTGKAEVPSAYKPSLYNQIERDKLNAQFEYFEEG